MTVNPEDVDLLDSLLAFDPLAEAEGVTGKRYTEDEATLRLAMGMHMNYVKVKNEILHDREDTYYSMSLDEAIDLIFREGFELQWQTSFTRARDDSLDEVWAVFWNPIGYLITLESYQGDRVNSFHLYGNHYRGKVGEDAYPPLRGVSCHVHKPSWDDLGEIITIWDKDGREALVHFLHEIRFVGIPLAQWREPYTDLLFLFDEDIHGDVRFDEIEWSQRASLWHSLNRELLDEFPPELLANMGLSNE